MAEGAAVMLFYQVGELFQSYAVGKIAQIHRRHDGHRTRVRQRRSATGELVQVDPFEVARRRRDHRQTRRARAARRRGGLTGASQLDTAALTGESVPRDGARQATRSSPAA